MDFLVTDKQGVAAPDNVFVSEKALSSTNATLSFDPRFFIGLELSLVPEVEGVYVAPIPEGYRVWSVINERKPEIRAKLFVREQAIMDELRSKTFDFNIISRDGVQLEAVGVPVGEVVFKR